MRTYLGARPSSSGCTTHPPGWSPEATLPTSFFFGPIRRLAGNGALPKSAPINPSSAATVHSALQKNCVSEPTGATWLMALR